MGIELKKSSRSDVCGHLPRAGSTTLQETHLLALRTLFSLVRLPGQMTAT